MTVKKITKTVEATSHRPAARTFSIDGRKGFIVSLRGGKHVFKKIISSDKVELATEMDNTSDPLRPSKETAAQLVALLSQCNINADSVVAQMQHNLDLLRDARLELRTAINILADSNKLSESRHEDMSVIAGQS